MNKFVLRIGGMICLAGLGGEKMMAQVGQSVVGSGAVTATQGSLHISATIAQGAIGPVRGTEGRAFQGFWHPPAAAKESVVQDETSSQDASSTLALSSMPNPISGSTTLSFSLPTAAHAALVIFNAIGQQVRTAAEGDFAPGTVSRTVDLSDLPSGSYTALLRAGDRQESIPLILVN